MRAAPYRFSRRRAVNDFSRGQSGDITTGDNAGGNISTNDPGPWLEFLERYLWDIDQARTRRDDELAHELKESRDLLAALSNEFDLYQQFVANRFAADAARHATTRLLAVAALVVAATALGIALL